MKIETYSSSDWLEAKYFNLKLKEVKLLKPILEDLYHKALELDALLGSDFSYIVLYNSIGEFVGLEEDRTDLLQVDVGGVRAVGVTEGGDEVFTDLISWDTLGISAFDVHITKSGDKSLVEAISKEARVMFTENNLGVKTEILTTGLSDFIVWLISHNLSSKTI